MLASARINPARLVAAKGYKSLTRPSRFRFNPVSHLELKPVSHESRFQLSILTCPALPSTSGLKRFVADSLRQMTTMAPLSKSTRVYATHEIPLECDIYETLDYPKNKPVFLFFHSGGCIGGNRVAVPPWLVQTCLKNQWPLISASYRLLPQVKCEGLLEDAKAAYEFAQKWGDGPQRKVIVGGASGGAS